MGLWSNFLSYFKEYKLMISIKVSSEQALSYSTSVFYARRGRMYYSHAGQRSLRSKLVKNIFVLPTFNIDVSSRPSESLLSDRLVSLASFQWNVS
jgi:hypothetical protein